MLTYERLYELLSYNSETGIFRWKISRGSRAKAGAIAGCRTNGYIVIGIDGVPLLAHRLAWLYIYGYVPEGFLDHKNQKRNDNRINNLREISQSCNIRNSKMLCNNISGIRGVYSNKRYKKWAAQIKINKKQISLGLFSTKLDAAKARHDAEIKYNWSACNTKESSAYRYIQTERPVQND